MRRARDLIRDEAFRSRDGQEIGGALYGEPAGKGDSVTVTRACGPSSRSTRSTHKFTIDPAAYAAGENGPVRWLGDWHTHPQGHGIPSDGDLKGWARTLEAYGHGADRYVGLIVTAPLRRLDYGEDARPDWTKPIVHGWVLSRLPDRLVCEPANVEGW